MASWYAASTQPRRCNDRDDAGRRLSAADTADGAGRGETVDPILGGLVRVLQRERGYRFSLDARWSF